MINVDVYITPIVPVHRINISGTILKNIPMRAKILEELSPELVPSNLLLTDDPDLYNGVVSTLAFRPELKYVMDMTIRDELDQIIYLSYYRSQFSHDLHFIDGLYSPFDVRVDPANSDYAYTNVWKDFKASSLLFYADRTRFYEVIDTLAYITSAPEKGGCAKDTYFFTDLLPYMVLEGDPRVRGNRLAMYLHAAFVEQLWQACEDNPVPTGMISAVAPYARQGQWNALMNIVVGYDELRDLFPYFNECIQWAILDYMNNIPIEYFQFDESPWYRVFKRKLLTGNHDRRLDIADFFIV